MSLVGRGRSVFVSAEPSLFDYLAKKGREIRGRGTKIRARMIPRLLLESASGGGGSDSSLPQRGPHKSSGRGGLRRHVEIGFCGIG